MKKSIAFLGALLFGSVTFGQVTKNDSINKSTSRKVSSEDMKKFPEDIESTTNAEGIKGESKHKGDQNASIQKGGIYKNSEIQKSSDNSAGKGARKGEAAYEKQSPKGQKNSDINTTTTEKQHYTIKMNTASKKTVEDGVEPGVIKENAGTTQKKQDIHLKMPTEKVAKDPVTTPTTGTSDQFIKITDIKGEKEK